MTSLPDKFDKCIIGKTVGPFAEQLVYSLGGLLKLHDGDREATALLMKQAYTEHGAEAPVFADDTLRPDDGEEPAPPAPEPPRIITDLNPKVIPPFPGTLMPAHRN